MAKNKLISKYENKETMNLENEITATNAPKIISTVNVNLKLPKLDSTYYRARFIEDYHQCPLCGDELHFTHVTHFVDGSVSEKAECEACNVETKNNNHCLH